MSGALEQLARRAVAVAQRVEEDARKPAMQRSVVGFDRYVEEHALLAAFVLRLREHTAAGGALPPPYAPPAAVAPAVTPAGLAPTAEALESSPQASAARPAPALRIAARVTRGTTRRDLGRLLKLLADRPYDFADLDHALAHVRPLVREVRKLRRERAAAVRALRAYYDELCGQVEAMREGHEAGDEDALDEDTIDGCEGQLDLFGKVIVMAEEKLGLRVRTVAQVRAVADTRNATDSK